MFNLSSFIFKIKDFHANYFCCCLIAKSCLTLCNSMGCGPPGSSVHRISQAKILEWVAISFSRVSPPRDRTHTSCTGRKVLYHGETWEAPENPYYLLLFFHRKTLPLPSVVFSYFSYPFLSLIL